MRHGLDLISKKSLRRWSPKKKWNSRHIYLGKTCKAFDMRWLNISKRPRIHSHSPCARRVQSWEWSKISFEPDGRFINKMFLFNFIMSTFSNLFLDISFSDEPRLVSVLWRFLLSDDLILQLILRDGHLISAEEYLFRKCLPFLRLVPPLHFFLLTEGGSTQAIARRNAFSWWSIPCDHYSWQKKAR